jgi:predicted dehydrogenase
MRIGIIGTGFGITAHLPAFKALSEVEVVGIADSGSRALSKNFPAGIQYMGSWRELLESTIEAVSVVVPPDQQREIVIAALKLGKHVFCEKPFGLSVNEALEMCQACQTGTAAVVNFQFRFEPGIESFKNALDAGVIGEVYSIDLSWITKGRAADPETLWSWQNDCTQGGGVINGFFSHVADLFCWLVGNQPAEVFGHSQFLTADRVDKEGKIRKVTAEDAMTAIIMMRNGVSATCRITNCQLGGEGMCLKAWGTDGVLVYKHSAPFGDTDRTLFVKKNDIVQIPLPNNQVEGNYLDSRTFAVHRCAGLFVQQALGSKSIAAPSFLDGLRVQRIIHALRDSISEGRKIPISI